MLRVPCQISEAFPVNAEMESPEQPTILSPHYLGCQQPKDAQETGPLLYKLETTTEVQRKMMQNSNTSIRQIQDFLEPLQEMDLEQYLLPPKTLLRYALILDIVRPTCRRSICFTKGYVLLSLRTTITNMHFQVKTLDTVYLNLF